MDLIFSPSDLKLLKFNDNMEKASDWKIVDLLEKTVVLRSLELDKEITIPDINLFELMKISVVRNNVLEGCFRPVTYKGRLYLLKEGTEAYINAFNNISIQLPTLKVGGIYKLKSKNIPILLANRMLSNIDITDLNLKWTFLGKIFFTNCKYKRTSNTLIHSDYMDSFYLFLVNKQFVKINKRTLFDLIEYIGSDQNYDIKSDNVEKINDTMFREFKFKYEEIDIPYIDFSIYLDSENDYKNMKNHNLNYTLIRLKDLVGII